MSGILFELLNREFGLMWGGPRMFYGYDYSTLSMVVIWIGVSVVFGVSLHLALKVTKIKLERNEEVYVTAISSLVALTPAVGPYLAFIPATVLTYRMAHKGFGNVFGAMTLTWLFTLILLMLVFGSFRVLLAVEVF
jgi:hypothetical protein